MENHDTGNQHNETQHNENRKQVSSLFYIMPPVLMHILSMALLIAPTQQLIIYLLCPIDDYAKCTAIPSVQSSSAFWLSLFQLANALPGLISVPLIGLISDKYGRKFAFLFPSFGAFGHYLVAVFVIMFKMDVLWLLFANLLHGFLGGFLVLEAISFAYIAGKFI